MLDIEDNEQKMAKIVFHHLYLMIKMANLIEITTPPPTPPVITMEFESSKDTYNYYNCHAKELGFAIKVKFSGPNLMAKESMVQHSVAIVRFRNN